MWDTVPAVQLSSKNNSDAVSSTYVDVRPPGGKQDVESKRRRCMQKENNL